MFTISVPDGGGRDAFFAAVRAALPLDPPVPGSHSWDALSRSLFAGLRGLGVARVEIHWPDAARFAAQYPEDSVPARAVLEFVTANLAADGYPVRVRTFFDAGAPSSPRFAGRVERDLRAAGWFPGRKVDTSAWRELLEASGEVRMHEAAERFLGEFGGLKVAICGPGISVAREPFEFNPGDLDGEEGRFAEWGATMGTPCSRSASWTRAGSSSASPRSARSSWWRRGWRASGSATRRWRTWCWASAR